VNTSVFCFCLSHYYQMGRCFFILVIVYSHFEYLHLYWCWRFNYKRQDWNPMAINHFNPATFVCLSQAIVWISIGICHGLVCVQWDIRRGNYLFTWGDGVFCVQRFIRRGNYLFTLLISVELLIITLNFPFTRASFTSSKLQKWDSWKRWHWEFSKMSNSEVICLQYCWVNGQRGSVKQRCWTVGLGLWCL